MAQPTREAAPLLFCKRPPCDGDSQATSLCPHCQQAARGHSIVQGLVWVTLSTPKDLVCKGSVLPWKLFHPTWVREWQSLSSSFASLLSRGPGCRGAG